MDATMAPCALDPGWPNVLLYASFWRDVGQSVGDQPTRVEEYGHSGHQTWTICPDRTDHLRYMRTILRGTEVGSDGWTTEKNPNTRTGLDAIRVLY